MLMLDNDFKVRDQCHITGKCKGFPHRDCNMNLKLNPKLAVMFQNLKKYDPRVIMQELAKSNPKVIGSPIRFYYQ